MSRTPEGDRIFEQIQMVSGGHKAGDVLQALLDSVACTIAFMVNDMSEAKVLIATLPRDVNRTVRENWDYCRALRARSAHQESTRVN